MDTGSKRPLCLFFHSLFRDTTFHAIVCVRVCVCESGAPFFVQCYWMHIPFRIVMSFVAVSILSYRTLWFVVFIYFDYVIPANVRCVDCVRAKRMRRHTHTHPKHWIPLRKWYRVYYVFVCKWLMTDEYTISFSLFIIHQFQRHIEIRTRVACDVLCACGVWITIEREREDDRLVISILFIFVNKLIFRLTIRQSIRSRRSMLSHFVSNNNRCDGLL